MKIVIPGGTGQVGVVLSRAFYRAGHEVTVLSRQAPVPSNRAPWSVVAWDGKTLEYWAKEFEGADAVINLAGRSVNCRYGAANRRAIMDSRVDSTRVIGRAIAACSAPPRVWLQASTATIYAHRFDASNDEATGILGGNEPGAPNTWNFSIDVAKAWEQAAEEVYLPVTRLVKLRSAMIMSPDAGGIFDTLLRLVRFGLGGTAADGQQYISWLHEEDFISAIYWLIEQEHLSGPVNLAAPYPLPNSQFMQTLRAAWGQPIGLPATRWMLEIGAAILRSETELILKSRRVTPGRLLADGFEFRFPHWSMAAKDLCHRWRAGENASLAERVGPDHCVETQTSRGSR